MTTTTKPYAHLADCPECLDVAIDAEITARFWDKPLQTLGEALDDLAIRDQVKAEITGQPREQHSHPVLSF